MKDNSPIIIVRGAGDLATGTIARLFNSGLKVLALEIEQPTVIRTTVSFAQALFDGSVTIEGITARKASNLEEAATIMANNQIPILVDPEGESITLLKPIVVVDAILAKKNLGTTMDMAPFVVALGPGFEAQKDCHCVIETKRGHFLGSIIRQGTAAPNSGIPGIIGGYGSERVLRAPTEGLFEPLCPIGTLVKAGDTVAKVEKEDTNLTEKKTEDEKPE